MKRHFDKINFSRHYRVNQQKCPPFDKILLPEYQRNDTENNLVLFPTGQTKFSNLPGFN